MKMGLSDKEGAVLHGLLADAAGDIVIRLDVQGFVEQGSDNLTALGVDLSQMLLPPHVAELADSAHASHLSHHFQRAIEADHQTGWIEFKAKPCNPDDGCDHRDCGQWYALSLRRLTGDDGELTGALGLLRSIERVRSLEDELFASALTDPLTGLVNRQVFLARLHEELRENDGGYLAVLAIDRMRALYMQYGQRAADEINWGFAKFLQTMAMPGSELTQLDGERFAVLLPGLSAEAARSWTEDLLETLSSLALPAPGKAPTISASAGLARIETSVDWTMRQAELALIMARAGGGNRLAQSGQPGPSAFLSVTANCDVRDDELGDRMLPR